MACHNPLRGYRHMHVNASGKQSIMVVGRGAVSVSKKPLTVVQSPAFIPCGRCRGCRKDRARSWAIRCVHESQMHCCSSFVTLTYSDKCVPKDGGLVYRDFQLFMKRLRIAVLRSSFRKRFRKMYNSDPKALKFYMCGEYGETFHRPHFHACIFGLDLFDKVLFSQKDGFKLYSSKFLEKIWGKGFVTVGDVSFASALYLAKYILKQYDGDLGGSVYHGLKAPFARMSRGGRTGKGIGHSWYEKFSSDLFPKDFVVIDGVKSKIPKYYLRKLMLTDRVSFDNLKDVRFEKEDEVMSHKSLREVYREMDAAEAVLKQLYDSNKRSLE